MQSVSGEEQVGVRRVRLCKLPWMAWVDWGGGRGGEACLGGWREGRGGVFGRVRGVEKNQWLGGRFSTHCEEKLMNIASPLPAHKAPRDIEVQQMAA